MKLKALAAVLAGLTFAPAFAAPEHYALDPSHSFPRFSYSHFGFSKQLARFNKTSGTVTLDKAARTAAVDVTIDMKSIDTGSAVLDKHIQDADFFDTANHPTATFKSTKVTFDGDKPVSVEGNLTIKGITRPVTLTVTSFVARPHPMLKKDAVGANASGLIKRSDFNAGKYAPNVGDEITLDIAVEAIKAD